jgi:hypothetical protein
LVGTYPTRFAAGRRAELEAMPQPRRLEALARAAGKGSGVVLIALIVADMFSPDAELMRSWYGFLPVCGVLFANCFFTSYALRWPRIEPCSLLVLGFVAIGGLSVAASALGLYPDIPLLPRRADYVLRQSYFLFLILPFLIGGYHIWSVGTGGVIRFAQRFGIAFLVILPVLDIATAYFFGEFQDGYTYFLDRGQTAFLYYIVFSFYVVFGRKRMLPLLLMLVYILACRVLSYGALFNSVSAFLMALILVILSLPRIAARARAAAVAAIVPLALVVMTVEAAYPSLCHDQEKDAPIIFSHAGNTVWRCETWHSNMAALVDTYLVGVGYGVPYFPFTFENRLTAEDFAPEMKIPATQVLYIRGNHSSLVNVFYRLGLAGGMVFVMMNWILVVRLCRGAAGDGLIARLSLVACGLMVLAFVQISSNVGLESPRYLVTYALAVAFGVVCVEAVSAERRIVRRSQPRTWHRGRRRVELTSA